MIYKSNYYNDDPIPVHRNMIYLDIPRISEVLYVCFKVELDST